jgi:hypothetical protein
MAAPALAYAQQDPVVGNWRGTVKSAAGTETTIVITIAKNGDKYFGSTTGLSEGADVPLTRVDVSNSGVTLEAASESRLGSVSLSALLTPEGPALNGAGTVGIGGQRFPVTFALRRRARADVVQRQVDQQVSYFVGTWAFDYVGGEFPPLSIGNRKGELTIARIGTSSFASGTLKGDSFGTAFEERVLIGVEPESDMLVMTERRGEGLELVSLGNWKSPLAVTFTTSPVTSGGKTYQLRRVFSILSDTSFDVTEEFSVDGGPFRRLGAGHYTKQ